TAGGALIMNVEGGVIEHEQSSVTVHVTEVAPPQNDGAVGVPLVNCGLHPPLTLNPLSHAEKAAFAAAWLAKSHAVPVVSCTSLTTTAAGAVMVNVAVCVVEP